MIMYLHILSFPPISMVQYAPSTIFFLLSYIIDIIFSDMFDLIRLLQYYLFYLIWSTNIFSLWYDIIWFDLILFNMIQSDIIFPLLFDMNTLLYSNPFHSAHQNKI